MSTHHHLIVILFISLTDILVITRSDAQPRLSFCSQFSWKKVKQRNIIDKYLTENVNNEAINIQSLE